MKPRYRVVLGPHKGYRLEVWRWWWPVWITVDWYYTVAEAEEYAKVHARLVVKYIPPFDGSEAAR